MGRRWPYLWGVTVQHAGLAVTPAVYELRGTHECRGRPAASDLGHQTTR